MLGLMETCPTLCSSVILREFQTKGEQLKAYLAPTTYQVLSLAV